MVSNSIINKCEPEVIGVYCKIAKLSSGKTMTIDFISKYIKVSDKKLRKIIVELEDAGYIYREPIKGVRGSFSGWNYKIFSEPISEEKRSHAGKKKEKDDDGLTQKRTSPSADKSENGKDNIIRDNDYSYNKEEIDNNKEKESIDVDKKVPDGTAPTDEELTFIKKMKEKFPHIMRMEQPLTLKQAKDLKEKFDHDLLVKIMGEVENWRPLVKNKVSAYKVILKWCQKEMDRL